MGSCPIPKAALRAGPSDSTLRSARGQVAPGQPPGCLHVDASSCGCPWAIVCPEAPAMPLALPAYRPSYQHVPPSVLQFAPCLLPYPPQPPVAQHASPGPVGWSRWRVTSGRGCTGRAPKGRAQRASRRAARARERQASASRGTQRPAGESTISALPPRHQRRLRLVQQRKTPPERPLRRTPAHIMSPNIIKPRGSPEARHGPPANPGGCLARGRVRLVGSVECHSTRTPVHPTPRPLQQSCGASPGGRCRGAGGRPAAAALRLMP
jgi:hypothetical protein